MKFEEILAKDPSPGKKDRLRIEESLVIFPKWTVELDCHLKNYKYTIVDDDYIGYKKRSFGHITRVLKTNTKAKFKAAMIKCKSERLIYLILTEEYIFKEDLSLLKIITERGLLN